MLMPSKNKAYIQLFKALHILAALTPFSLHKTRFIPAQNGYQCNKH